MSNYDEEPTFDDDETPPEEEGSNRTFLISAGVLGGLVLLGLLCAAGYLFFTRSSTQQQEATAYVQATRQQATIQAGLTQKAIEQAAAQALTQAAAPTNTLPPTSTPVIAQATFTPAGASLDPAAAGTIAANLTQISSSRITLPPRLLRARPRSPLHKIMLLPLLPPGKLNWLPPHRHLLLLARSLLVSPSWLLHRIISLPPLP